MRVATGTVSFASPFYCTPDFFFLFIVFHWAWDAQQDECSICRTALCTAWLWHFHRQPWVLQRARQLSVGCFQPSGDSLHLEPLSISGDRKVGIARERFRRGCRFQVCLKRVVDQLFTDQNVCVSVSLKHGDLHGHKYDSCHTGGHHRIADFFYFYVLLRWKIHCYAFGLMSAPFIVCLIALCFCLSCSQKYLTYYLPDKLKQPVFSLLCGSDQHFPSNIDLVKCLLSGRKPLENPVRLTFLKGGVAGEAQSMFSYFLLSPSLLSPDLSLHLCCPLAFDQRSHSHSQGTDRRESRERGLDGCWEGDSFSLQSPKPI